MKSQFRIFDYQSNGVVLPQFQSTLLDGGLPKSSQSILFYYSLTESTLLFLAFIKTHDQS